MPRTGCCQRTSASKPTISPVSQVDRGLVVQRQLVALQRAAQVGLELEPLAPAGRASAGRSWRSRCRRPPWPGTWPGRRCACSCSDVAGVGPAAAMPMLAPTCSSRPSMTNGAVERVDDPLGDRLGVGAAPTVDSMSTANSSPPKRATVSPVAHRRRSRSATWTSSWSPAAWPRLSLTSLNPSRSRNSTATSSRAAAAPSASASRSRNSARLASPVRRVVVRLVHQLFLQLLALADVAGVEHQAADAAGRRAGS